MGLFKKNSKKRKSIIDAASDLRHEIEGEVLPSEVGLDADDIERLLELFGQDNAKRIIFQRRVGSILDKATGLVFWRRPHRMTVEKAKALAHEIAEKHKEREEKLLKKLRLDNPDYNFPKKFTPEEIEYLSRLSPDDVLAACNVARKRLAESPQHNETLSSEERRAKRILDVLEELKHDELLRFARHIAMTQRQYIEGKTQDGDAPADVWAAHGIDDTELERIRTMQGFGKKPLKTLIDEAGDVVDTNVDAAAKVVKQWIGNQKNGET